MTDSDCDCPYCEYEKIFEAHLAGVKDGGTRDFFRAMFEQHQKYQGAIMATMGMLDSTLPVFEMGRRLDD